MQNTSQRSGLRSPYRRRRLLQHRRNFMRRRFCLCDLSRRKRTDPQRSQSCGVHRTGETVAGPHARMMCSFEAIPVDPSPHRVGERTTPGLPAAGTEQAPRTHASCIDFLEPLAARKGCPRSEVGSRRCRGRDSTVPTSTALSWSVSDRAAMPCLISSTEAEGSMQARSWTCAALLLPVKLSTSLLCSC